MKKTKPTAPLLLFCRLHRLKLILGAIMIAVIIALIIWIGWTPRHSVTFYQNDGTNPSSTTSVSVIEGDLALAPPNPRRLGYIFLGWTGDAAGTEPFDFETQITEDLSLYAQWHAEFSILFYPNDGDITIPARVLVLSGEQVPKPDAPNRPGFHFLGWTKDQAGEYPFDFASPVTERRVLFAQWHAEFAVTFHQGDDREPEARIVLYGERVPEPGTPSRLGYRFLGWTLDTAGERPFDFIAPIAENLDLFAQWRTFPPPTDELDELLARHGNNLSVYFKNLDTGFVYFHNADRIYMGASVPKASFSLYIYQKAEVGDIELDERQLRLLRINLSYSDNDATLTLARMHGTAGYRQFVADLGGNPDFVVSSVMGSRLTAKEAGLFALAIYDYIESDSRYSEEMKTHLLNNQFPFIVSDYPVASKSGWTSSVFHDLAIVYAPSSYILVILSERMNHRVFAEISMAFQTFNNTWFVDEQHRKRMPMIEENLHKGCTL